MINAERRTPEAEPEATPESPEANGPATVWRIFDYFVGTEDEVMEFVSENCPNCAFEVMEPEEAEEAEEETA